MKQFDSQIGEMSVTLEPGSCLLLCTDGLAECRGERGSFYTRERILFDLRQSRADESSRHILERLLQVIQNFAGDHPQEDDMTAILIRRLPKDNTPDG